MWFHFTRFTLYAMFRKIPFYRLNSAHYAGFFHVKWGISLNTDFRKNQKSLKVRANCTTKLFKSTQIRIAITSQNIKSPHITFKFWELVRGPTIPFFIQSNYLIGKHYIFIKLKHASFVNEEGDSCSSQTGINSKKYSWIFRGANRD